ncbi:MAG: hypothetical protein H0X62_04085 [Bacteroidetes bacterium]|nr:hypothetical protein [Bacteroidota bacterium]
MACLIIGGLSSCKKTVTAKKLDGTWEATSGVTTITYENGDLEPLIVTHDFDGNTVSISNNKSENAPEIQKKNITYTFDSKSGTYSLRTFKEFSHSNGIITPYYIKQNNSFVEAGNYTRKVTTAFIEEESGTFSITGGTGEIEKYSQIVFSPSKETSDDLKTYVYYDSQSNALLDIEGKYMEEVSSTNPIYAPLVNSVSEKAKISRSSYDQNKIVNVESLKKGEMRINFSTFQGDKDFSTTYEHTLILREK